MIKKISLLILLLVVSICLVSCTKEEAIKFTEDEYILNSGEAVALSSSPSGAKYKIINNKFDSVSIDSTTGVVTFNDTIPNYSQIMVVAEYKNQKTSCIVTLEYTYQESEITFTNLSKYIVNGEYVNATSSKNYSVRYFLKNEVSGISIDEESGKVEFAPIVQDGTVFTITANSHGSKSEMTFVAMKEGFVEAITSRQALSKTIQTVPAVYPLDFSKANLNTDEAKVLAVVNSLNEPLDTKYYNFNETKSQIEIDPSYVDTLNYGENYLKIVTSRNTIEVELDVVTKFIYSAEELAEINSSEEALSGYYVLMKDIDLTEYLSSTGKGYNDGKGWTPIGVYTDTLDTTIATKYSFKGTFDGNGHVITGLYANRKDVYSFNAGLFGYVTSTGTIKNLGVQGELTVSSYSGGLVGSNSGIISNCWADVNMNVESGENAYRYVGGLAGNNFGTIENCYSTGLVLCDREFGKIIGSNDGTIINCYSHISDEKECTTLIGFGSQLEKSKLFNSLDEMNSFNWSEVFPSSDWTFTPNNLPQLKETLVDYNVRAISINIPNNKLYNGERIDLNCNIYPNHMESQYINNITYKVEGEGCYLLGNYILTENASQVKIIAELNIDGIVYKDEVILDIYDKITEIKLESELTEVVAGKSYLLEATYSPSDANDIIYYELDSKYYGITITDNILTIDDEYSLTNSITLYAITESGLKSNSVTLNVIKQNKPLSGVSVVYLNSDDNFEFTFSDNVTSEISSVKLFGKNVEYSTNGNKISINRNVLDKYKDFKVRFIITLNDGTIYGCDAYYMSHEKYQSSNITDPIYINSVEDFFKYFNADKEGTWSEEKLNNYNKTFILTTDLDFGGKELYGIGTSEVKFSGKFYGMGHTISNFIIKQNERYCLGEANSSYYGVGLFANVSTGEFYDINVSDARIDGKNFAGALVGMITDGIVENCHGSNLKVYASEYQYTSEDVYVGKIVGRNYNGKILCVYYDGSSFNAVG